MLDDDPVSTYILPVVTLSGTDSDASVDHLLGTAFLVGSRGFALTCGHVIARQYKPLFVLSATRSAWRASLITAAEVAPADDVAILTTGLEGLSSPFRLSADRYAGGAPYFLYGYPEDAAYELRAHGRQKPRPDILYSEGHVRRRMTGIDVPGIRGRHLFELSTLAGAGTSGSPVMFKHPVAVKGGVRWQVVGLYLGERVSQHNMQISFAGYAARADEFVNWRPEILEGRSLLEEAATGQTPRVGNT